MALIFVSHRINLVFDSEAEASSAYAALEPHVKYLTVDHSRGTNEAESWTVRSEVLYDSTVAQVQAIANTVQGVGEFDIQAREAFDTHSG